MCTCYTLKQQKYLKRITTVLSFLLIVLGAIIIDFGLLDETNDNPNSMGELPMYRIVGGIWIFFGLLILSLSMLGMAVSLRDIRPHFTVCFNIGIFIVTFIALLNGIIFTNVGRYLDAKVLINAGCYDEDYISGVYNSAISKNMCTDLCPCNPGVDNQNQIVWNSFNWQKYKGGIRQFGRVQSLTDMTPDEQTDYQNNRNLAAIVPFIWSNSKSVNNFQECYKMINETNANYFQNPDLVQEKEFLEDQDLQAYLQMINMEKEYECASVCKTPLFYATKDLEYGPPEIDCMNLLTNTLSSSLIKIGSTALVLTVFGVILFVTSCGFCAQSYQEKLSKNNIRYRLSQMAEQGSKHQVSNI